jgi:hypothetical protein
MLTSSQQLDIPTGVRGDRRDPDAPVWRPELQRDVRHSIRVDCDGEVPRGADSTTSLSGLLEQRRRLIRAWLGGRRVKSNVSRADLVAIARATAVLLSLPDSRLFPDPVKEATRQVAALTDGPPLMEHQSNRPSWMARALATLEARRGQNGERLALLDPIGRNWTWNGFAMFVASVIFGPPPDARRWTVGPELAATLARKKSPRPRRGTTGGALG